MKLNTKRDHSGRSGLSVDQRLLAALRQHHPADSENTFHISDTISGGIMAIDNVLALFYASVFGSLSDKVHTKLGRRTPFILCGTAAAVIAMFVLPFADNIGSLALLLWHCALR